MTGWQDYFEIISASPIILLAVLVVACLFVLVSYWLLKRKPAEKQQPINKVDNKTKELLSSPAGKYRGMILSPGVVNFTTIEKPLGEPQIVGASLPKPGQVYLIKQEGIRLIDYDERKEPYNADTTPSQAYICTHCDDIIQDFWTADVKWYQNTSNWFAAGMLILDFFAFMAVVGQ